MGDIMYTVEKIENNMVRLEDRKKNIFFEVDKKLFPSNLKEGDIVDLVNGEYIINDILTNEIKNSIRNKFNSLMN